MVAITEVYTIATAFKEPGIVMARGEFMYAFVYKLQNGL